MRKTLAGMAVSLFLCSAVVAQQQPYVETNPDKFLSKSRSQGRPAIVLFNFHLKSG